MYNKRFKSFQSDNLYYSWCIFMYNAEIEYMYIYAYKVIYTLIA